MITTCSRILRLTKSRKWVWKPSSGDYLASHGIRRRFVDTSQITVHLPCFPMAVHDSDASLPSPGSAQEVRSPDSSVLSRRCDSLMSISLLFVAFDPRYHCSTRPWFRSRCRPVRSLHRAWSLVTRLLQPGISLMEKSGPPKFPGSLLCPFAHIHATPAGRAFLTISETTVLPPLVQHTKAPAMVLSRLSYMASELAVYASQGRLPIPHARLAPGCWSGFAGRDFHP